MPGYCLQSCLYCEQVSDRSINYNVVGKHIFLRDAEAYAFIYCLINTYLSQIQGVHIIIL